MGRWQVNGCIRVQERVQCRWECTNRLWLCEDVCVCGFAVGPCVTSSKVGPWRGRDLPDGTVKVDRVSSSSNAAETVWAWRSPSLPRVNAGPPDDREPVLCSSPLFCARLPGPPPRDCMELPLREPSAPREKPPRVASAMLLVCWQLARDGCCQHGWQVACCTRYAFDGLRTSSVVGENFHDQVQTPRGRVTGRQ